MFHLVFLYTFYNISDNTKYFALPALTQQHI